MPPRSVPTSSSSPLNDLRDQIVKGAIKVWDVEGEDPVIQHQRLVFLSNLIARTDPKSKLAYQICHYMEADYLDIDGIEEIFPMHRVKHKAERKKIEEEIKLARNEEKQLLSGTKGVRGKKASPDLQVHIDAIHMTIESLQGDLESLDKGTEYKDVYPMSKPKEAKRSFE